MDLNGSMHFVRLLLVVTSYWCYNFAIIFQLQNDQILELKALHCLDVYTLGVLHEVLSISKYCYQHIWKKKNIIVVF